METDEIQSRIQILDENTANQIAAGEVIERPASVVKELVENAIDAGASRITIELEEAGKSLICITDDGDGMNQTDILIALQRHATSKIRSVDDLFEIRTMGFRGEAMPSIASVSDVTIISRPQDADPDQPGTRVRVRGGKVEEVEEAGARSGTSIRVEDLFFNVPARLKFLKTNSTELGHITEMAQRFALAQPHIAFKVIHDSHEIFSTAGTGSLLDTSTEVFGRELARNLVPMDYTRGDARVTGFIGNPNTLRGSRSGQHTFVNRRFVRDRAVTRAIDEGYRSVQTIHGSKHPILVLNVEIDPSLIDVNVSPTKTEVRFTNERDVFSAVYHAIASALVTEGGLVQQGDLLGSPQVSETQSRNADRPVSQPLLDTPSSTPVTTRQYDSSYNRPSDRSFQADRNADISEFHNAVIERAGLSGAENTGNERDPLGDETQAPSYSYSGGAEQNRSDEVERSAYPPASPATERRENNGDSAPSKSPHRDKLTSLRVLAQTRNTYILAQTDTSLCIIDQHIAHERVLYERLLSGQASGILTMQHLMFPITLELGKKEALVTQARLGDLNKAGFLLEEFGSNSFLVRALPSAVAQGARAETVVREVIDELVEKTESRKLLVPAEEVLITASCKMAVKAGDPLTFDEMNGLLADLLQCENPYTCPHGRPIIVEIGNADMDRRFGR